MSVFKKGYYDAAPPDPKEPRMKDCPYCHGTGRVEVDEEPEPMFDTCQERDGER